MSNYLAWLKLACMSSISTLSSHWIHHVLARVYSLIAIIVIVHSLLSSPVVHGQSSSIVINRKKPTNNSTSTIKTPGGNLMLANKQAAPKFSYVVWDEQGIVCILAKFEATLTITFNTPSGEHQLIEKIPIDAKAKGRCDYLLDEKPVLDVTWIGGFTFRIIFEKIEDGEKWGINSIDLLYNTADSLFRGSVQGGKKVARTREGSLGMFDTLMGKSYFCPSPPIINLFEAKTGKPSVVVRLTNVHLQAFQIEKGKFAPISRCSQVSFGSGVAAPLYISLEQDDSVPVVVGTLTVIVSILVIVGYAVYKSWVFKPVDYDTMI